MKYDIVKLMARRKIRWKKRWVSGDSGGRLTFRSKKAGRLSDYRIYGNTVDGESVGDRTGNLFDEIYPEINNIVKYRAIYVGTGFFTLSSDIPIFSNTANLFLLNGNVSSGASSLVNGVGYGVPRSAESIDGYITIGYRNYYDVDPRDYNTMLNEGSTALPYEPYGYKVPVTVSNGTDTLTTPIYLPEQIRKVGNEVEYIDYSEQKMHRIGSDDVDVTLPALPTLTGTNVLSVGTAVQPSRVEVKGRIKAVGQETEPEPETAEPEQETAEAEQEAAEPEQEEPEVKEDDTDDR